MVPLVALLKLVFLKGGAGELGEETRLPNSGCNVPARSKDWLTDSLKLAYEKIAESDGIAEPTNGSDMEFREAIKRLHVVAVSMSETINSNVDDDDADKVIRATATQAFENLQERCDEKLQDLEGIVASLNKAQSEPFQGRPTAGRVPQGS